MNKKFKLYMKRLKPSIELCPDFWKWVESNTEVVSVTEFMPIGTDTSTTDCVPYFRLSTTITKVRALVYGKKCKILSVVIPEGKYKLTHQAKLWSEFARFKLCGGSGIAGEWK